MKNLNEQIESLMNIEQFLFAVSGTRLSKKNIEIARKALVEGVSRNSLLETEDINKQRLFQILEVIKKNMALKIEKQGFHFIEAIVTDKQKIDIEHNEIQLLSKDTQ